MAAEGDVLNAVADFAFQGISKAMEESGFDNSTKESATALVTAITTLGNTITSKKQSLQKKIKELETENAKLRAKISELTTLIQTTTASETAQNAEIKRLKKELEETQGKLAANNKLIPKLMRALTSKINELNTAMSADAEVGATAAGPAVTADTGAARPAGAGAGTGTDSSKYFQKYLKYKQKYLSIKN